MAWIRAKAVWLLMIAVGLFIVLGLWNLDWKPMPVMGLGHALNDQVQYISGARNLSERGQLQTNVILPSTLGQQTKTKILYVPGHYWILSLAFLLFGVNFLSSISFSLLGYVAIVAAVYLCGNKLFGKKAGILAAILTLMFPFYLLFSLTAMAEMSVIASSIIAMLIFLYLPFQRKTVLGPVVAMIPIFFRETSLIVLFPMAALIWREAAPDQKLKETLRFIGASLLLGFLVVKGLFGGRPDLIRANVFGSFSDIYTDAMSYSQMKPTLLSWVTVGSSRLVDNLWLVIKEKPWDAETFTMKLLLMSTMVIMVRGIKNRDVFESSIGLMGLVLWVAILSIYAVTGYRGLRTSLVLGPFFALVLGHWMSNFKGKPVWIAVMLIGFSITSYQSSFRGLVKDFPAERERETKIIRVIDELNLNKEKIVVAPFWLVYPWVSQNYPVRYSFLPHNHYSFRLLQGVGQVGSVLLHESELTVMPLDTLKMLGFKTSKEFNFEGNKYLLLVQSNS